MQELEKWLTTAREDVEKQQTQESKEKLLKKYNANFALAKLKRNTKISSCQNQREASSFPPYIKIAPQGAF